MATLLDDILIVPTKLVLIGIFIGAVSGLALAQFNPGPTLAAVQEKAPFTSGSALSTTIAKFDGDYYAVGAEPSVSLTPLSSVTVRKIGYGRTSFVNVVTTSSGTYSSDGLASPYVKYPGIHVEPLELEWAPWGGGLYGWSKQTGWTAIPMFAANSFGYLDASAPAHSYGGACVKSLDSDTGVCR